MNGMYQRSVGALSLQKVEYVYKYINLIVKNEMLGNEYAETKKRRIECERRCLRENNELKWEMFLALSKE